MCPFTSNGSGTLDGYPNALHVLILRQFPGEVP
jgi:hypothetical protein